MALHEVAARVGYREKLENGYQVETTNVPQKRRKFGLVALHESRHIVASDEIEEASIRPTATSLGHTIPRRLTPEGVAAPAAFGDSGVGWDLFLALFVLKVSPEHAKEAARAKLAGQTELVEEVAGILEERTTIYQADVEEAKENVRRRKEDITDVDVRITNVVGEEVLAQKRLARKGVVMVENTWYKLPKAV